MFLKLKKLFKILVHCWKKLALKFINDRIDLIRHFGLDQSPHLWFLLKSRNKAALLFDKLNI